jgi:transcriptional regulator NrdR family protein
MSRLECPKCKRWKHAEIYNVRSRTLDIGISGVIRGRRCRGCGFRYKTVEVRHDELLTFAFAELENKVSKLAANRRKEAARQEAVLRRELQDRVATWAANTGFVADAEGRPVPRVRGGGGEEEEGMP